MRAVQRFDLARYGEALSDASLDLLAGLAAGLFVAVFFAWRRSAPIDNMWQRGVIAVLAAVGALLINFFLSVPADLLLGLAGLALLAAASIAFGLAGGRWASKGSGRG